MALSIVRSIKGSMRIIKSKGIGYIKKYRQDKDEQAFYNSEAWLLTREYIKGKYKGLCLYSYYVLGEIVFSDMVHHIVELKEDWDLRLDGR
jgi:hypothetical protein